MNNNAQLAEFLPNSDALCAAQTVKTLTIKTNQGELQHAAWGAFQAGMQVLQNYAGRSPANMEAIAKANLRLLHRTLLNDPVYAQSIKRASDKISSNASPNNHPITHCIFDNKVLRAELITLQCGGGIPLQYQQDSYAMFLAISGKPSIRSTDVTPSLGNHWWNRYHQQNRVESLRKEDAVIVSSHKMNKTLLIAEKKKCILLRIQLKTVGMNSAA